MVNAGSHTTKHYSAVASNILKAIKGDSFSGRKSTVARNAAVEKEGKLFVQVLYPDNVFTAEGSLTTLYIKVVQYKGGTIVPAWY
jgi:hypothetical protein